MRRDQIVPRNPLPLRVRERSLRSAGCPNVARPEPYLVSTPLLGPAAGNGKGAGRLRRGHADEVRFGLTAPQYWSKTVAQGPVSHGCACGDLGFSPWRNGPG